MKDTQVKSKPFISDLVGECEGCIREKNWSIFVMEICNKCMRRVRLDDYYEKEAKE